METCLSKPPKLFATTEEEGHWYQRLSDGGIYVLTKEEMKQFEDWHIRPEHYWSHYDPIEDYNWKQLELAAEDYQRVKTFLATLTPEQRSSLEEKK